MWEASWEVILVPFHPALCTPGTVALALLSRRSPTPMKGQLGRLPQSNCVSLTLFPHLPHLVEMDDEDGRCLLDVIW